MADGFFFRPVRQDKGREGLGACRCRPDRGAVRCARCGGALLLVHSKRETLLFDSGISRLSIARSTARFVPNLSTQRLSSLPGFSILRLQLVTTGHTARMVHAMKGHIGMMYVQPARLSPMTGAPQSECACVFGFVCVRERKGLERERSRVVSKCLRRLGLYSADEIRCRSGCLAAAPEEKQKQNEYKER